MTEPSKDHTHQKNRNLRRVLKRIVVLLAAAAALTGVVLAALPKPVVVELATAKRGELVVTVDEDGKARVKDRFIVSAPLAGNLARIELRAGDEVKQGDVIARLVPLKAPLLDSRSKSQAEAKVAAALAGKSQARAQVERAKAALDYAEKEAVRYRSLLKERVVSHQEVDRMLLNERSRRAELTSAEFGAKVASHTLSMSRAALGHYKDADDSETLTVTSPVSGRVLKLIQQSEGVVQAGTPLLEVGDPSALEIVVDVLTSDAVKISPGSRTSIEQWGGEDLEAVVRSVEPSAFTRISALGVEEQRVNAIVDLKGPYELWSKLGDGYRVEARIEIFRSKDSILVPQSALFRHQGRWTAFVMTDDGVAKRLFVKVGRRNDTHAAVEEGIAAGDRVLVHPSDKVAEGVELQAL